MESSDLAGQPYWKWGLTVLPSDRDALNHAVEQMQRLSAQLVRLEERESGHSRTLDRLERMITANATSVSQLIEGVAQIRELVNGHEKSIQALQRSQAQGVSEDIARLPSEVAQLRAVDEQLRTAITHLADAQADMAATVTRVDRKMMWWGGGIAVLAVVATVVVGMARWRIVGEAPPPTTVILKMSDGKTISPVTGGQP